MKTVFSGICSLAVILVAAALPMQTALAQGGGGGKGKSPVQHTAFFGTYTTLGNDEAVVLGPFDADTSLEIFSITSLNRNQTPMILSYRAIQPVDAPVEPADCTVGPAAVIDEITRAVIPGFNSFHQAFPEGTEVPGYVVNTVLYAEATGPWCVVAFVNGLSSPDDTFEGRLTFRINYPE